MSISLIHAAVFLLVAGIFLALALLALLAIGSARLESYLGTLRDGLPRGTAAPSLPEPAAAHRVAGPERWQLLVFADHSLREFPSLARGLRTLATTTDELEVIILTRRDPQLVAAALGEIDSRVRLLPVDDVLYRAYNVRVMPYVFFVDPRRLVRACSVVNYESTLLNLWQIAQRAPVPSESSARRWKAFRHLARDP